MSAKLPVTEMFEEMVRLGYIRPPAQMEEMRLPGEYAFVPSVISYGTPDVPIRAGIHRDAKLGQHSQGDRHGPSDSE